VATNYDDLCRFTKGPMRRVRTVTATYAVSLDDDIIICAGAAPFTATLPLAASAYDAATGTAKVYWFMNPDTDDATIDGNGAETINGAATFVLDVQYEWVMVTTDGTSWYASL
jgi:hypothetical protein